MASMRVTQRASMETALLCAVITCDSLDERMCVQPIFVIILLSGAGISFIKEPHVEVISEIYLDLQKH